jgi:hypothetical protein
MSGTDSCRIKDLFQSAQVFENSAAVTTNCQVPDDFICFVGTQLVVEQPGNVMLKLFTPIHITILHGTGGQ